MSKTLPSASQLLWAYSQGYFPMPEPGTEEIQWYRPDPRAILPLDGFHLSRSFKQFLKRNPFTVSRNTAFSEVLLGCADRKETWINSEFKRAYLELHQMGHAHSIEVWTGEGLVGGVYGVQLGGAFFAESMFSKQTNASKFALHELSEHLKRQDFCLLEIQFLTSHLASLGALEISDEQYETLLTRAISLKRKF